MAVQARSTLASSALNAESGEVEAGRDARLELQAAAFQCVCLRRVANISSADSIQQERMDLILLFAIIHFETLGYHGI